VAPQLLERLRAVGEEARAPALPAGPAGLEPLCAYYPRAVLETLERQLDRGEMRLSVFVASLSSPVILSPNEVARFGSSDQLFANINTLDDLADARHREASRGGQRLDLTSEPVAEQG
jgi:molybdopterin-guanine dinucleotide biosynthesis protein A